MPEEQPFSVHSCLQDIKKDIVHIKERLAAIETTITAPCAFHVALCERLANLEAGASSTRWFVTTLMAIAGLAIALIK